MKKHLDFIVGIALLALILWALIGNPFSRDSEKQPVTVKRDTLVIRDTVRLAVPKPIYRKVVRVDTVRLVLAQLDTTADGDTVQLGTVKVEVPISKQTYQTDKYKAVISGFRASLDSMEVYQDTKVITEIKYRKPRFAVSMGAGVNYYDKKFIPTIGINFGYVIWSK